MLLLESLIQKFNNMDRNYKLLHMAKTGNISLKNYDELTTAEKALLTSRRYGEIVSFFVKRMKEVKPNFYFGYLEKNIESLKIKNKLFLKSFGSYSIPDNVILLKPKHYFASIFHELMHMATRYRDTDGVLKVGFYHVGNIIIGRGLNEGYTQLLTERYFYDQVVDYSYKALVPFVKDLETIVGKDRMEDLFFSADLNGLKEDVLKDTTEDKFMQFLDDLDWFRGVNKNSDKIEIFIRTQRVGNFVYLTYLKKQLRLFNRGEISKEEYFANFNKTIDNINTSYFNFNGFYVWKCDKEKIVEELNEIGISVSMSRTMVTEDETLNVLSQNQEKISKCSNKR